MNNSIDPIIEGKLAQIVDILDQGVDKKIQNGSGLTSEQSQKLEQAHTHSTSLHAPANAQKK